MKFTNYICPVCKETFKDEDDVVVCPECGTPHHRYCWMELGRCFNHEKHGTEAPIEVEFADVEDEAPVSADAPEIPVQGDVSPEEIKQVFEKLGEGESPRVSLRGSSVSYYEAAIGKNQEYYIPRFMLIDKSQKGASWNLFAFIVPLAWTLYRKMYKFAALIFAVYMLIFGSLGYFFMNDAELTKAQEVCMAEDPEFITKVLMYQSDSYEGSLTPSQIKYVEALNNVKIPTYFVVIRYIVLVAIKVLMGIFGTKLYYGKLTKSIEKHRSLPLGQKELMTVLYKHNGTFPFFIAAIIGFIEFRMF